MAGTKPMPGPVTPRSARGAKGEFPLSLSNDSYSFHMFPCWMVRFLEFCSFKLWLGICWLPYFFLMFLIHRKYRNLVLLKIPYRFIADMSIYFVVNFSFPWGGISKLKTIAELVDPEKTCKNPEIVGKTKVSCWLFYYLNRICPIFVFEQSHKWSYQAIINYI